MKKGKEMGGQQARGKRRRIVDKEGGMEDKSEKEDRESRKEGGE